MVSTCASLGNVISLVRRYMRETSDSVEVSTERVLTEHPNWNAVALDVALKDQVESQIFKTFLSSPRLKRLALRPTLVDASTALAMLRQAIPLMTNLEHVVIANALTEAEAEDMFSILVTCSNLSQLGLLLGNTTGRVAKPLAKFLRDSTSLKSIELSWAMCNDESFPSVVTLPKASLRIICEGIGRSTSLETVALFSTPQNDAEATATLFANAVGNSLSIEKISAEKGDEIICNIRNALMNTPFIQNFDLCFCTDDDDGHENLRLHRNNQWKQLLPQDVSLSSWPQILKNTKTWNKYDSHKPLDALFFLLKEKNDVLVQNVESVVA